MILGVTGKYSSGKDTVASILAEKGFKHYSLPSHLREELVKEGKELTRINIINKGNELRKKHGTGILAEIALQKMKPGEDYVITSFRNPGEVEVFRKREDFVLITVDAPIEVRFERMQERTKINNEDNALKTVEELRQSEQSEMSSDPTKQQLHKVIELANVAIDNSKGFSELKENVDKLLKSL